jgi:hypothetical protein
MFMKRLALGIVSMTLGIVCIVPFGCRREPVPDHLGLFAVAGHEVHELPSAPAGDEDNLRGGSPSEEMDSLEELSFEDFSRLYSDSSILPVVPEYFILYDPKFNPGDLHLYNITGPRWQHGKLALDVAMLNLNIEPLEGSAGMYRLRPVVGTLSTGQYYVLTGAGESATGTAGYLRPFCSLCDLNSTRAAIEKARDEEAARIKEATTPKVELFRERVRVAPYGADYYCTTCFWDVTVTDVDITWTRNPNAGVNRASYADLQNIVWDTRWRCLELPPLQDSACVLQTSSSDESKLQAIAATANTALMRWRQKYPQGLPYAEGPMGD